MWWCVFWYIRTPRIGILRIRCWRRRRWICKKTFPDVPCVSQILGGLSLRLGIRRERLSIPPGSWKGLKNAGWLITWDCPLRTDSTSFKSLESFMQLTSFCSSCILAVSSRIVSRSSTNFLVENPSNVDPWNRFNSSISLRLFIWASRSSRFCSSNRSSKSCWSRRSCSSPWRARLISLRWDSIIPFNVWILPVSSSAWNLCFWISALQSARICSFCRSRRILICSLSESRLGFSLMLELSELSSCTGIPVLSDKLVYGPLVLLAPEWTIVKRAHCRWCRHWFPQVRGPCVSGGLLDENFSGLWEVVVVEGLGLITCERNVVDKGVRLLICGSAQGTSLRTDPHGRWRWRSGGWSRRWDRETVKSAKWRVEERSDTQAHETWMTWRGQPSWANVTCDTVRHACKYEKMWRVRVFCSHSASVAADCHQL